MLIYVEHPSLNRSMQAVLARYPGLRVLWGLDAPPLNRAMLIGPLHSLPFEHQGTGPQGMGPLPADLINRQKAMGVEPDSHAMGTSRFSPQHLSRWEAFVSDPWVLLTLSRGYSIQFRRQPPKINGINMTVVNNRLRSVVLREEIVAL